MRYFPVLFFVCLTMLLNKTNALTKSQIIMQINYLYAAGSMPPPAHYEYSITINDQLAGEIIFYPDYPADNTPFWQYTYNFTAALWEEIIDFTAKNQFISKKFASLENPPIGGSLHYLTIFTAQKQIKINSQIKQKALLLQFAELLKKTIPPDIWSELQEKHKKYQNNYQEK
jgi:hypothetical protein